MVLRVIVAIAFALGLTTLSRAAEVTWVPDSAANVRDSHVMLRGRIEAGDLGRLKKVLDPDGTGRFPASTVRLDSPGGDFEEGLAISKFIHEHGIYTYVDRDAECYSSCAIVFMHGTEYIEGVPFLARTLHQRGKLGFHAPFMIAGQNAQATPEQIKAALEDTYQTAMSQMADLLDSGMVSPSLVSMFLRAGPTELLMVDTFGKTIVWGIRLVPTSFDMPIVNDELLVMACDTLHRERLGEIPQMSRSAARRLVAEGGAPRRLFYKEDESVVQVVLSPGPDWTEVCNFGLRRSGRNGAQQVFNYGFDFSEPPALIQQGPLEDRYFREPGSRL